MGTLLKTVVEFFKSTILGYVLIKSYGKSQKELGEAERNNEDQDDASEKRKKSKNRQSIFRTREQSNRAIDKLLKRYRSDK